MTQENANVPTVAGTGVLAIQNSIFLNMQRFADAQRVGSLLAGSTMVPAHFHNQVGNCIIALNLADRLGVDVFMLMQSMYVVYGRPGIEAKLIIALIEGSGRFSPLQYRREGKGKTAKGIDRPDSCVAYATELKTGLVVEGPAVTWAMAEAEGWLRPKPLKDGKGELPSKWHTMPDLMFMYRAATFFGRVHCPGAILGLRTTDEIEDVFDLQPTPSGGYAPPPKPEDAPAADPEEIEKAFAASASENGIAEAVGEAMLADFLERVARASSITVAQVKADVVKTGGSDFWKTFKAWVKQEQKRAERAAAKNGSGNSGNGKDQAADPGQTADPPQAAAENKNAEDDPTAPHPCPDRQDQTFMKQSYCEKNCKGFVGCPAWFD